MFNVQPLSQQDPRWKDKYLGSSTDITIGQYGCLLTSMTMLANGLGYNETPASFNDKMLAGGGFSGGLIRPTRVGNVFPGMRIPAPHPMQQPARSPGRDRRSIGVRPACHRKSRFTT
ncbi:MAG TPA: hypothetical protein VLH85_06865, partial [Levilinea sp.]|nr:hypothetical protein [Levilinea sp.]